MNKPETLTANPKAETGLAPLTGSAHPSKSLKAAQRTWCGKTVRCYVRSVENLRCGPHIGYVKALSDNQVAIQDEGGREYGETGLLVEIPDLGTNATFGVWPVRFDDAEIVQNVALCHGEKENHEKQK